MTEAQLSQLQTQQLTLALVDLCGGKPGNQVLAALISTILTVLCQTIADEVEGQRIATEMGEQLAREYAIARAMLNRPAMVN